MKIIKEFGHYCLESHQWHPIEIDITNVNKNEIYNSNHDLCFYNISANNYNFTDFRIIKIDFDNDRSNLKTVIINKKLKELNYHCLLLGNSFNLYITKKWN